jgi:hypothetical protein
VGVDIPPYATIITSILNRLPYNYQYLLNKDVSINFMNFINHRPKEWFDELLLEAAHDCASGVLDQISLSTTCDELL